MNTLRRSRRHFLGRAAASMAGLGLASLLDGVCRSPVSPASRAAADSLVPDDSFVRIPQRPSFAFATNLTNSSGAGEAAPILTDYCLTANLVTNKQYKAFVDGTGRTSLPRHWASGTYRAGKE